MLNDMAEAYVERRQQSLVIRFVFGVAIILILSLVMSCQELRYMVSGKVAETMGSASLEDRTTKYGEHFKVPVITYMYQDGDTSRRNVIDTPSGFTLPEDGKIKVQYIPGRDASRLLGQTNRMWVYIFFGSIIAAVVGFILLAKYG